MLRWGEVVVDGYGGVRGVTRVTGSEEDGVTVSVRGGIDYEPRG
jgi:hypothetical protein